MQCLVPTVLVRGNSNTQTTTRINRGGVVFCVCEKKLGHFKQQPKAALPKFLGKPGLPCTSSPVLSNTADTALELPGGGQRMAQMNPVSPGVMGWGCLDLLLVLPLEESSHGALKPSEKSGHTHSCTIWLQMGCFFWVGQVMVLCCSLQLIDVDS